MSNDKTLNEDIGLQKNDKFYQMAKTIVKARLMIVLTKMITRNLIRMDSISRSVLGVLLGRQKTSGVFL